MYAIAAAVGVPGIISQTKDAVHTLQQLGVIGELIGIVGIAVPFAIIV